MKKNIIYNKNCLTGIKDIPDNSVDLIIADPPYNLSKSKNSWKWDNEIKKSGFGGKWSITNEGWDDIPFEDYWNFSISWIKESIRVLKKTGSIWVFGTYHNTGIFNVIFQLLEIEILNEIIWYKRNSFPNLSNRRFTASHENILWGHIGGKKREYYFNHKVMKEGKFPEDNLKIDGKQMRTVWDIPNNKKKEELKYGKHPTQKPIRVLKRIIHCSTKPGDLVLVPFSGSGSECVTCKLLNRDYIGFEINEEFVNLSEKRLTSIKPNIEIFEE
jgi:site-specific DNA-methyltransferase (adenine-specific)